MDDDGGANEVDPTLLFIYCGTTGAWDYASTRLPGEVVRFIDNLEPTEVAEGLEIDGDDHDVSGHRLERNQLPRVRVGRICVRHQHGAAASPQPGTR